MAEETQKALLKINCLLEEEELTINHYVSLDNQENRKRRRRGIDSTRDRQRLIQI